MKRLLVLLSLLLVSISAAELRVATFNIRYAARGDKGEKSWTSRRDLVVETIQQMNPDVLGIQEALDSQLRFLAKELPEYSFLGVGRDDGRKRGEYSAIFYRKKRLSLDAKQSGTFWLSDTPDEPGSVTWGNAVTRVCTWGKFTDRSSGKEIFVYNTHWDHRGQPSREKSAQLIREHIAEQKESDTHVVVMGDFNASETSAELKILTEGEGGLSNSFLKVNPDEKERGTFNGWKTTGTGGAMIDHVLTSFELVISESQIVRHHRGTQVPSDHFPVLTILKW
ncbi:endonuclease/exonuclease/phosphatase family protein [Roseibacillus persicicus]|uniref:endonuclease/exonuclease/phosphatase family protein n=1 Tax=Roseibacillus persicicus TaxID=454148 RepID=UPI002810839D|nr:endonuclease/exonuclease/phosphatase family protein [Roseibacillus persicicus]MDQ8189200.1 endonuclease/exonuclease/phosphatase family protein [Roseibacillus persicicus]